MTDPSHSRPQPAASWKSIIVGTNGLRAGWRLLIFLALAGVPLAVLPSILRLFPSLGGPGGLPPGTITPAGLGGGDAIILTVICIATWIMGRIEHRKFSEYGLPPRQAFGKEFWFGALLGFLAINGTLLAMFLLHGFRVVGLTIHGTTILSSLVAWTITFLVVALFEEFGFRGYVQYTLTSGIRFWPAAFVISGLFGLGHLLADVNENVVGSIAVVMFGLLLCLFLWRTGNLWCAVGFHMAYDWGETFFYGVPDSGLSPRNSLLTSAFSGPHWLTGGKVGPEASVLTPIALLVVALIFSRRYRENRYQILRSRSLPVAAS
ncbi:MAG TPA: CPBP family intramembrane glutamic endopeptidase [Terriglobales bacterium]|nr:CPBP family intramembrane glutamic endopeptidase [Terriglobales bacterium]